MRQVLGEEAVAQALRFDPARAASLIVELDPDRVATQVLMARLALLSHDDREAARLLADLPPPSTRRARVERAVLCALSVLEHDVDEANHHLGAALIDAQPEWLVRTIVELGPNMHKLLVSFTPNADQEVYVEALLAAAGRGVALLRANVERLVGGSAQCPGGDGAALPVQPSHLPGDRGGTVRVGEHAQVPRARRVPQARRGVACRRGRHRSTVGSHLNAVVRRPEPGLAPVGDGRAVRM